MANIKISEQKVLQIEAICKEKDIPLIHDAAYYNYNYLNCNYMIFYIQFFIQVLCP